MILGGVALREAAPAQELRPVVIGTRHDPLAGGPDAGHEAGGGAVGEARQGGCGFGREAMSGVFRVADDELLELLDTPQVAVGADGAEVERRDAEGARAHLRVPAVKAAEVEVG